MTSRKLTTLGFEMSQATQSRRVGATVDPFVVAFFAEHAGEEFHLCDLVDYVRDRCACNPTSPDRRMRALKKSGHIDYTLISKSKSLYQAGSLVDRSQSLREHARRHLLHEPRPVHREKLCAELERISKASADMPVATASEWDKAITELAENGSVSAVGERVAVVRQSKAKQKVKQSTKQQQELFA